MSDKVFIRFECGSEDRIGRELGPYPWIQVTYDAIRVGEDGDTYLAHIDGDGRWVTADGQWWSDFVIGPWKEAA